MADQDSAYDLIVRARLEGGSDTAGGVRDIGGAVEDLGPSAEKGLGGMNEHMMRSRRLVSEFTRGILEFGKGGKEAFSGIATESFVAAEGAEALGLALPEVVIPLTLLASILLPRLIQGWGEQKTAIDKNKDSANDFKTAIEDAQTAMEKSLKEQSEAFKKTIDDDKAYIASFDQSTDILSKHIAAIDTYRELVEKLTIAQLQNQEQQELVGVNDADEIAAIEAKYKAKQDVITAQGEEAKNAAQQRETAIEIQQANEKTLVQNNEYQKVSLDLQQKQAAVQQAVGAADALGIPTVGNGADRYKPAADLGVQQVAQAKQIADAVDASVKAQEKIVERHQNQIEEAKHSINPVAALRDLQASTELPGELSRLTQLKQDQLFAQNQLRQAKERSDAATAANQALQAYTQAQTTGTAQFVKINSELEKLSGTLIDLNLKLAGQQKEASIPALTLNTGQIKAGNTESKDILDQGIKFFQEKSGAQKQNEEKGIGKQIQDNDAIIDNLRSQLKQSTDLHGKTLDHIGKMADGQTTANQGIQARLTALEQKQAELKRSQQQLSHSQASNTQNTGVIYYT